MAYAEILGDAIRVDLELREKALIKSIPGSRWQRAGYWLLPLSWGSCKRLRNTFGEGLEIGEQLLKWAAEARQWVEAVKAFKYQEQLDKPFAYQINGTGFLWSAYSGLLADEPGLGKSKQTIDAITSGIRYRSNYNESVLIICPNSLKYTWKDEWTKWAPAFNVYVVDGTASQKKKILDKDAGIFIINWESLRGLSRLAPYGSLALTEKEKEPGLLNRNWSVVVADEAHRAKDPRAKQTRALWAIGASASRRIALTGTPIANTPEDLWAIMHFVAPKDWPSRAGFIDRYCQATYNFFGGLDVLGLNPATQEELFEILEPHYLRRTKAEVLKDLPEKTYQTRYIELAPKQRKYYKAMEDEMILALNDGVLVATNPLTQLQRLNQLAQATPTTTDLQEFTSPSCKLDALREIIDESPEEPLVVFVVNTALAYFVEEQLLKAGISTAAITGQVPSETRTELVADFQEEKFQVIVLTTGTGSEGITLTRASRCVFLQRPWSAIQYKQAQDRIHRIGQTQAVQIIDVVAKDTIEEQVVAVLDEKDETLQQLCRDPHWLKVSLTRKEK
jgi:SNF2 family DNA or RNA helicase